MKIILFSILILCGLSLIIGLLIFLIEKLFVKQKDLNQKLDSEAFLALLAGYNCGGCGYPTCSEFAEAMLKKNEPPSKCKPNSKQNLEALKDLIKEKRKIEKS